MRFVCASTFALALAVLAPAAHGGQQEDPDRVVAGGGISVPGWKGKVDAAAAQKGGTIEQSKFVQKGTDLHMTVGPAAIYWNPANKAAGDYSVKGTFTQPKAPEKHPHPAGIFIGGSNLDGDKPTLLYCVAYSDGTYLVRGFSGGTVNTVSKRQPHEAVRKAEPGASVTQEIAWNVRGNRAECAINGTTVASFEKGEIVGPGKLDSTDGIFGIRVSHNLDVVVSGFGPAKATH